MFFRKKFLHAASGARHTAPCARAGAESRSLRAGRRGVRCAPRWSRARARWVRASSKRVSGCSHYSATWLLECARDVREPQRSPTRATQAAARLGRW